MVAGNPESVAEEVETRTARVAERMRMEMADFAERLRILDLERLRLGLLSESPRVISGSNFEMSHASSHT